jgi:Ca2+-binding RTX toxin-like protein
MAYIFSLVEQAQITAAANQGPAPGQAGNFVAMYSKIRDIVSSHISDGTIAGTDKSSAVNVLNWLNTAIGANGNEGFQSAFIRAYTNRQGLLRIGAPFSVDEMQEASNAVARNFLTDLTAGLPGSPAAWQLVTIENIARDDASAIGQTLFQGRLSQTDTAVTQNAAWSGAFGFALLGSPQQASLSLLSTGGMDIADTLDDWKNVIFAYDAYARATAAGGVQLFKDWILSSISADPVGQFSNTVLKPVLAQVNIGLASGQFNLLVSAVADRTAAGTAIQLVSKYGEATFLDFMRNAYNGAPRFDTTGSVEVLSGIQPEGNFAQHARAFAQSFGVNGQQIKMIFVEPTDILAKAKTSDLDAVASRNALRGLTPLVITNLDQIPTINAGDIALYDPLTGQGTLTTVWLADRGAMLVAVMKDKDSNHAPFRSDRPETQLFENKNSLGETDVSVQVTGKQPFAGNPVHIIFGGDAGETLSGGVLYAGDHLYGGGGNDTLLGLGGNDYLEGNAGIDTLEGGDDADTLIGGADADRLDGGAGNDRLEGGLGFDTYVHGANGGLDRIRDVDGAGKVEFAISGGILTVTGGHRTAATEWRSDDHNFVFDLQTRASGQQDLWITGNNERVLIENFTNDNLGIHLDNAPVQPVLDRGRVVTFDADRFDYHDDGDLQGSEYIIGNSAFNWIVTGWADAPSTVEGRGGADYIVSRGGDDVLFANNATDLSNLISGSAPTVETLDGATLIALAGNDLLVGGTGADWIIGGKGEDIIYAGAGNDVVSGAGDLYLGVTNTVQSTLPGWQKFSVFTPFIGLEVDGLYPFGAINEALNGDHIIHSSIGLSTFNNRDSADTIYGGAGDDQIWGVFGDDELYGEAGNDQIRGGEGADTIYGGEGNDEIRGDDDHLVALELFGNDFIDGGAGEDLIYGELGEDDIYGGLGNDQLHGEEDNDFLSGDEGDDSLYGGDGWDILIGGAGSDVLNGGAGFDTYVFNTGDGQDQIVDSDSDSLYVFRSVFSPESLRVTVVGSDVKIQYGGSGDSVTIANAYVTSASGVAAGPTFELADGSTVDVPLLLNVGTTDPIVKHADGPGQTVVGGSGDDTLTGAAAAILHGGRGNDVLTASGGNNTLDGGEGNDVLVGGPGANVLSGGAGDDVYRIGPSDGVTVGLDVIDDVEGENTVQFNSRIQLSDLTASAVVGEDGIPYLELSNSADYTVRIREGLSGAISHFAFSDGTSLDLESLLAQIGPLQVYGDEQDNILTGTGIADAIDAGAGADVINAGDGNDILNGGTGDDTLNGQAGDDRYVMSWGMGHDVAIDAGGGIITLGTGLVSSDLYSHASGADLFVGIKFTDERLLIKDYQSAAWRIDTGTGQTIAVTELSDIASVTSHEGFFDHALAQRRAELFSDLTRDGFRMMPDGTLERGTQERGGRRPFYPGVGRNPDRAPVARYARYAGRVHQRTLPDHVYAGGHHGRRQRQYDSPVQQPRGRACWWW